jgi:hypothetical protein
MEMPLIMNEAEAEKLAQSFLSKKIELHYCGTSPQGIYDVNFENEMLFRFKLFGEYSIGGSPYVAVSKETGEVRYLGYFGE